MSTQNTYQETQKEVNGIAIVITSYAIEEQYYCHIRNVDPGATIARGKGANREEAIQVAMGKAKRRL